ncbi:hypothetical protein FB107DRAFT_286226 [Schizophyllum commune]
MPLVDVDCNDWECELTGATDDVRSCRPIPLDASNGDERTIARQEWLYGLPRGGLFNFLRTRANCLVYISDMYCRGEFILAPTFRTYIETKIFIEHAGVKNRRESDDSPRRPLTALASRNGRYRYVFIPVTDAARALQRDLNLPLQTEDDLNHGKFPDSEEPYDEGSDKFAVVECHAHPYSVSVFAHKMLKIHCTPLTGQWFCLAGQIMYDWVLSRIQPPQWFINSPKLIDMELAPSEGSGYDLSSAEGGRPEPLAVLGNPDLPETDYRKVVADWTYNKVVYGHPPPAEKPIRYDYKMRRSTRLHKCPYDRDGPPPSPIRNGPRALLTCRRNFELQPPSWSERNGRFPTHTFTSNDWAYFEYGVHLPGSSKS